MEQQATNPNGLYFRRQLLTSGFIAPTQQIATVGKSYSDPAGLIFVIIAFRGTRRHTSVGCFL